MTKEERFLTLHPQGKKGVNILKRRYEAMKDFILSTISSYGEISYQDLNDLALDELKSSFDGKILWYLVSVKLDLEAREMIERVPKTSPHVLRMKG
ncbi:MAG: hypothetical protein MRZ79_12195 [Bacteroidia bacterium]|nr:hypothetical protein [Bacteroidia bacterium]